MYTKIPQNIRQLNKKVDRTVRNNKNPDRQTEINQPTNKQT